MQPHLYEPYLYRYVQAAWVLVALVWLIGAFATKRTERTQTSGSLLIHIPLVAAAFALLFEPRLSIPPLSWRFVPSSAAIAYTGLALTFAGVAFAIWARLFLGRNWSGIVTIKQDHQLVSSGPYAVVRHPIYSGFLLAMLGGALVLGEVRGLLAVGCALVAWWYKSRIEEKFMEQQFGVEYAAYTTRVKALIPFVL